MASPFPFVLKQRYRVLNLLGTGGFGTVYKAEDITLGNRLVAVKEMNEIGLSANELIEAVKNFEHEALILASLHHPNLPHIYDHFKENNHWYLIMDFIEGETLDDYLKKAPGKKLPVKEVLDIGITLCKVLHYLHTQPQPVIFRDLKPVNIMLAPNGHLYLIDFGIARYFKPGQAKDTIPFGSQGYAPPEQYSSSPTQTTPRSDIYALGATLHQMITANDPYFTPFKLKPPLSYNSSVPSALDALIMQMLKLYEDERPASVADVKKQLQDILKQMATKPLPVVQPVSPPSPPSPPPAAQPLPAPAQPPLPSPRPVRPIPAAQQLQAPPAVRGSIGTGGIIGIFGGILVVVLILAGMVSAFNHTPPPPSTEGSTGSTIAPAVTSASNSNETITPTPTEISHGGTTLAIPSEEQFVAQATTAYLFSYRDGAYSSSPCDAQANDWTTALSVSFVGSNSSNNRTWSWFDFGYFSSWDAARAKAQANGNSFSYNLLLNAGDTITLTPAGNAQCFSGYGAETVDVTW